MISLKHISTLPTFNQTKFSADSTDSNYFLGSDQNQIFQGTPDVKYNDLCYIKCSNLQYTHGHLYRSTEVGDSFVKQIANLSTYNGIENEIVQYVGEDTNDYKRGFFYKMTPTPTTTTTLVDIVGLEEGKGYISEGFDPTFWVKEKHPNFSYLTGLFTTGSKAPTGNDYATGLNPNTTYRFFARINSIGSGGYFAYDVNDTNVYQLSTYFMQIDAYADNKITVRDRIGGQYEQELTDIETIAADYRLSDETYTMGDYYAFNINFPKNANTKLVINSNMTVDSKYELMEIEYETVQEEREVTIMQLAWQQQEVGNNYVSLTQEEYDALSEDEKNNGKIYLIKDVINPDDLTVSGDATIAGSLTVGGDTITGIDNSLNITSSNPVKNSVITNIMQNFYDANTPYNVSGNKEKAIQNLLNDIMPKVNSSGDVKFAVIRHQDGWAFLTLMAQYGNTCFIVEFGFSSNDLITYQSTLSNGTWGTVSQLKSF